ncbi:ABC transporter permease [Microbacterium sp. Leaf347]|uniref:ABC transporter permease n=1 Tax=Microbacterium sp. Leaf347 TaxID=1736347 RepID=UPI0009E81E28|nr:ABC transporter permease [Microbacterium sp. Leaf347]
MSTTQSAKENTSATSSSPAAPRTETVAIGTLTEPKAGFVRKLLRAQAFQIFLVLLVIVLIFGALAPTTFAQWSNFRLVLQNASILAILAVGMTFVSGVVSAMTMRAIGGDGWGVATIGILVSIASGILWGLFNGFLIAKGKIPPLIVTLGTLGITLGLAQILTGGVDIREVPLVLTTSIGYGNVFGTIPMLSVIALVVVVIGAIALRYTRFGLYTLAVGSSEIAARRVGVKVDAQLIRVYVVSGALAGLAGILSLSQFSTTAIAGQSQTNLNVIAGVVIGGTSLFGGVGTILGSVVGLFIPAVLQNGFVITGVQPFWQQVAVGAVLITAVYVDQVRRSAALRSGSQGLWRKFLSGGRQG